MTDETRNPAQDADLPDEERIGALLRRHSALIHEPPATPREAIWERIEKAREGEGGAASGRGAPVIPLAPRRWWLGTLAVAAVLALGIALGRMSLRQETERQGAAGPPVASVEPPAGSAAPAEREPETGARPEAEVPAAGEAVAPQELAAADSRTADPRTADPPAGRRTPPPGGRAQEPAGEPPSAAAASDLYRLASQQMLGQAEALLVHYRSDRAADRVDPAVARWARDVLTSTRLLLDSPAADDPGMRALLEDLELVLAQIVQRTGDPDPLDDQMIERTIEDRDLMPRLRGAIPVGVGAI